MQPLPGLFVLLTLLSTSYASRISPKGECGPRNGYTCQGSKFGPSCSRDNRCCSESRPEHGCQPEYGYCQPIKKETPCTTTLPRRTVTCTSTSTKIVARKAFTTTVVTITSGTASATRTKFATSVVTPAALTVTFTATPAPNTETATDTTTSTLTSGTSITTAPTPDTITITVTQTPPPITETATDTTTSTLSEGTVTVSTSTLVLQARQDKILLRLPLRIGESLDVSSTSHRLAARGGRKTCKTVCQTITATSTTIRTIYTTSTITSRSTKVIPLKTATVTNTVTAGTSTASQPTVSETVTADPQTTTITTTDTETATTPEATQTTIPDQPSETDTATATPETQTITETATATFTTPAATETAVQTSFYSKVVERTDSNSCFYGGNYIAQIGVSSDTSNNYEVPKRQCATACSQNGQCGSFYFSDSTDPIGNRGLYCLLIAGPSNPGAVACDYETSTIYLVLYNKDN